MIDLGLSDRLRMVGWLLEDQIAVSDIGQVDIVEHGAGLQVAYQLNDGVGIRSTYPVADIARLTERFQSGREAPPSHPPHALAEALRTIGQDLDEQGIRLERLVRWPSGYRVTGTIGWHCIGRWYSTDGVREMSKERRGDRSSGESHESDEVLAIRESRRRG